jgi:hypothetical protein
MKQRSTEEILDRIHGVEGRGFPSAKRVQRKGAGFAWSKEEEEFLIRCVGDHGPHWADIMMSYGRTGQIFEGRDQIKLKDKARNLKERMLRYQSPPHLKKNTPVRALAIPVRVLIVICSGLW